MRLLFVILLFTGLCGCHMPKLPTEKYNQYTYQKNYYLEGDQLFVELKNPLNCPLRIWLFNPEKDLQSRFNELNPILLGNNADTLLTIPGIKSLEGEITFASRLGNPFKEVRPLRLALPFPKNREYRIIQGNNGNFTHNTDFSRYALDFNLKTNDTICAATDGYVVGVIDQYAFGGKEEKWRPFGNFITLYEPRSGIFTQYVHLVKNGSLVKVGDSVKKGQPIALSGKTGQTTVEHLHFSCLVPVDSNPGLHSIPYEFEEGYRSVELKKNDLVKK